MTTASSSFRTPSTEPAMPAPLVDLTAASSSVQLVESSPEQVVTDSPTPIQIESSDDDAEEIAQARLALATARREEAEARLTLIESRSQGRSSRASTKVVWAPASRWTQFVNKFM